MDPEDFIKQAHRLLQDDTPANSRTAVSRAYYAAFHVAQGLLRELNFNLPNHAAHGEVTKYLSNSGDEAVAGAGSNLADLQSRRVDADYRLQKKDIEDRKTAQLQVQIAKEIIKTLKQNCRGSKQQHIVAAIQKWRQMI
jgi:uncharacterized protein (UPF0332 family)